MTGPRPWLQSVRAPGTPSDLGPAQAMHGTCPLSDARRARGRGGEAPAEGLRSHDHRLGVGAHDRRGAGHRLGLRRLAALAARSPRWSAWPWESSPPSEARCARSASCCSRGAGSSGRRLDRVRWGCSDGQPLLQLLACPRSPPWPGGPSWSRCGVGAVALVLGVVAGYPLGGHRGSAWACAMALVNFRLISRATVKAAASEDENKRRPLVFNTLGRLGVISVIALGITFFVAAARLRDADRPGRLPVLAARQRGRVHAAQPPHGRHDHGDAARDTRTTHDAASSTSWPPTSTSAPTSSVTASTSTRSGRRSPPW